MGERPGEVARMRTREIDLEKELWTIPAARSKNKRDHVVPLVGEAHVIVTRLIDAACKAELACHDDCLLLVRARGVRPLQVNNLNWALRAALSVAGIGPAKPHDLRRDVLSHLGRLGINPLVIGHRINTIVTVSDADIQHDYFAEKRHALGVWDAELKSLLRGIDMQDNVVALRA